MPGPGAYSIDTSLDLDNAHRFGNSKRDKKSKHFGSPGPGSYIDTAFNSYYGAGNSASMKHRPKSAYVTKTPGPG